MKDDSFRYAVVGNPIEHSLSPIIHNLFAQQLGIDLTYTKIQTTPSCFGQEIIDFFNHGGKGLNITSPFKQQAFELSHKKTSRCSQAFASNTLWLDENGLINADNTDGIGLLRDLSRYIDVVDQRILLLGAGGAARGLLTPLINALPKIIVIASRTTKHAKTLSNLFPSTTYQDMNDLESPFDLIINATSTDVHTSMFDLPKSIITANTLCYDLNYHMETLFFKWARSNHVPVIKGIGMLIEQAAESFYIWHKKKPDTELVLNRLKKQFNV